MRRRRRLSPSQRRRRNSPIRKETRDYVYERDEHRCVNCGEDVPAVLSIDHIVPLSEGGGNHRDNLQVLCLSCNGRKKNTSRERIKRPQRIRVWRARGVV